MKPKGANSQGETKIDAITKFIRKERTVTALEGRDLGRPVLLEETPR